MQPSFAVNQKNRVTHQTGLETASATPSAEATGEIRPKASAHVRRVGSDRVDAKLKEGNMIRVMGGKLFGK